MSSILAIIGTLMFKGGVLTKFCALAMVAFYTISFPEPFKVSEKNEAVHISNIEYVSMADYKDCITTAENKIVQVLTHASDNTVISHIDGIEIYKYTGPYNSFDDLSVYMSFYCEPDALEFMLRNLGYVNVNGQLGMIAADGEVSYTEFDEFDMQVLSTDNNKSSVLVTKSTIDGSFQNEYEYTFKVNEYGKLIIEYIYEY